MTQPRFRVGDRVVVFKRGTVLAGNEFVPVGASCVVLENSTAPFIKFDDDTFNDCYNGFGRCNCTSENFLELEEIYNSSLYKALKEG